MPNGENKELIINSITRILDNHGDKISITQNINDNQKIKDEINIYLNEFYSKNTGMLEHKLNEVWSNLANVKEKAKFIYLLGHIAKSGALGYENNGLNQANELYYTLAKISAKNFTRKMTQYQNYLH